MSGLVVKPRARIFHGHEWVYGSDVQKIFGNPQPGDVISLKDFKDRRIGTAIYNPQSQIVARRFSRRKQELDLEFFQRRIERALELRTSMNFAEPVYRLVWSESDGLPGVVVDRYGDRLVLQTLTLAMDQRKDLIAEALAAVLDPSSIIERNDSPIRAAEGMDSVIGVLRGDNPGPFDVTADGVTFTVDLCEGQKTGLYLDQFDNYRQVAARSRGLRVLDCFCNQGGFALHCARAGAASVTAVDISEPAIESLNANAAANALNVEAVTANVFDYLKQAGHDGAKFDLVILDPPSFTRSRKSVADALRGYKEIHLRALRLLDPGGHLATYCCSHHVDRPTFLSAICDASVDARRTLRLLDSVSQRQDHPVIPTLPETEYLKGYLFQTMPGW